MAKLSNTKVSSDNKIIKDNEKKHQIHDKSSIAQNQTTF